MRIASTKKGWADDHGKSVNAVLAEKSGMITKSQITSKNLKDGGWNLGIKLAKRMIDEGVWKSDEWHHCSKYYNEVAYYSIEDLVESWEDMSQEKKESIKNLKEAPKEEVRVSGEYAVWGGTRKRPVIDYYEKFQGTLVGIWIKLDNGGRKKATGKWISYKAIK